MAESVSVRVILDGKRKRLSCYPSKGLRFRADLDAGERVDVFIDDQRAIVKIARAKDGAFVLKPEHPLHMTIAPKTFPFLHTAAPCTAQYPEDVKVSEGSIQFEIPKLIIESCR